MEVMYMETIPEWGLTVVFLRVEANPCSGIVSLWG